jgi:hypothetical protein
MKNYGDSHDLGIALSRSPSMPQRTLKKGKVPSYLMKKKGEI